MLKIFNIIMFLLIIIFIFNIYNYYSSDKNIDAKKYNRKNIDQILKEKIIDLPILKNDTNNIIEYVNNNQNENKKKYKFWELLQTN